MKAHTWFNLAIPCFCIVALTHCSWAQQKLRGEQEYSQSPSSLGFELPSNTSESEEYRRFDRQQWIANLEKAGIFNRFLPKPYRVAMPLMSFGDTGPKIMLTYAKNMPGNTGGKGLLLFITVEIP